MSIVTFTPSNQSANILPNTPYSVLYTDPANIPNPADTYTLTSSPATSTYTFNSNMSQIPRGLLNGVRYGACDLCGNIYVTSLGTNILVVINASGLSSIAVPDGSGLNVPSGIAIDLSAGNATYGHVYISNAGTSGINANAIMKYNPVTKALTVVNSNINNNLCSPRALSFNNNYSNLYVVNQNLPAGPFVNAIMQFPHASNGTDTITTGNYNTIVNAPRDIAFDACGNLYCLTSTGVSQYMNNVLKITGNTNTATQVLIPIINGLSSCFGLRFDNYNNLYISNNNIVYTKSITNPNTIYKVTFSNLSTSTVSGISVFVSDSGLNSPAGIFFDSSLCNYLYVLNQGFGAIYYTQNYPQDSTLTATPLGSNGIGSFGVNSNALLRVNMNTKAINVAAPSGLYPTSSTINTLLSSPSYKTPGLLTFDTLGNLYAVSVNKVLKLDAYGIVSVLYQGNNAFLSAPSAAAPAAQGFISVATDPSNDIFVLSIDSSNSTGAPSNNSFLRKITSDGVILTGTNGFSCVAAMPYFNKPTGLAIDKQSNVYVANSGNGTVVKLVLDSTRYNVMFATPIYTNANSVLQGLALDPSNNLYVADSSNSQIIRINPNTLVSSVFNNTIVNPNGLSFDTAGNLYVASNDASGGHVYKVTPAGVSSKLNTVNSTYGVAVSPLTGSIFYTDNSNCTVNKWVTDYFEFDGVSFSTPGTYGLTITDTCGNVVVTNSLRVLVACYNKNTTVLCVDIYGNEVYKSIQDIVVGDKVVTYKHGLKAVKMIGNNSMVNDPDDLLQSMYKLSKDKNPLLNDDLIVLGGHSLLVDKLSTDEMVNTAKYWGNKIEKVDDKELLLATVSEDFEQCMDTDEYTYYHLVLEEEADGVDRKYGIYVNGGVLSETTTEKFFVSHF